MVSLASDSVPYRKRVSNFASYFTSDLNDYEQVYPNNVWIEVSTKGETIASPLTLNIG